MKITREDLEGLVRYLEQVKVCVNENKKEDAKCLIRILQENIQDYISIKKELEVM